MREDPFEIFDNLEDPPKFRDSGTGIIVFIICFVLVFLTLTGWHL